MVRESTLKFSSASSHAVCFNQKLLAKFPKAINRVVLLVTPEYEGISRNGGIGTYYHTLSKKLAAEDFYIILLLAQSQEKFGGESTIPALKHIFSTSECRDILELQPTHLAILSQLQEWEWVDYESYCALFFAEAICALQRSTERSRRSHRNVATTFSNAHIYIEFPEMLGLGYRTVQAKRAGILGENCVVAVTLHSGHE